jgi:cell division protein ZapA
VAEVELSIGGHAYTLTCADGEEASLTRLGAVVNDQVMAARSAIGSLTESRQLLFAALFLADRLETLESTTAPSSMPTENPHAAARITAQAERIERLNQRLTDNLRVIGTALG